MLSYPKIFTQAIERKVTLARRAAAAAAAKKAGSNKTEKVPGFN
ncbi:hypothetical protein LCGC14_2696930, partial [marine sediment metagenome]